MPAKTWKVQPLYATVIEILEKKGSLTDMELFEALKDFDTEIGFNELNKTLMKMEVTGLITVSSLTKGRRLVELVKKEARKDPSKLR